ncbi:MAG: hypothetical protein OEM38_04550 [Gammaproteobacteria bacterium]|nr:hypothetical protein [Gammaproteobacteria bacterium]
MNKLNLVKTKSQSAEKICKYVDLEKTTLPLLKSEQSLSDFIQSLLQNHALKDAIGVIAQALPAREAVYWASLCVKDILGDKPNLDDANALRAADQWMVKPNEDDRYLNLHMAEKLEYATAASWVANAVFWSGGSITPKGEAKVEAPDGVFGKAVTGAILLASAHEDPKQTQNLYQRFIKRGINIAQGGKGDNV